MRIGIKGKVFPARTLGALLTHNSVLHPNE
jgi:hypothetical protein